MTPALREAVGEALRRFHEDALAVRSSGVLEDLSDAAHAGLYETVLEVRGEAQVIAAIERCCVSASSERVQAYRASRKTSAPPRISRGGAPAAIAPAWTVLFARVAAVVTDTGSPMAHASLVAREYGIAAVVGASDATRSFLDGELVTVDGHTGVVSSVTK